MPLRSAPRPESCITPHIRPAPGRRLTPMASNLLLVDESPLIHRVVELTMEGRDISVYSAEDIEEALTLARSLKPDFILASTKFKRSSGFDLCRTLKEDADLAAIPVLLLAGAKEEVTDEEAVAAGAIGVLTKPFEPESLLAEVEKALAASGGGDKAAEAADPTMAIVPPVVAPTAVAPAEGEENIFDETDMPSELDEETGAGDAPLDFGDMDEDLMDESLGKDAALEIPPSAAEGAAGDAPEEESAPNAPAEAEAAADEEGGPLVNMGLDEFLDDFDEGDDESGENISGEAAKAPAAGAGEEELDPTQLAIENALADDLAAIGDEDDETGDPEDGDSEAGAPEADAGEAAPSALDAALDEDIDATLLAAENALSNELESLSEDDASLEDDSSAETTVESLLTDMDDPPGLEEAETELAVLQSELAADFEAPDDVDEGGLEHLADDQIQAAEEQLASIQEELSEEAANEPAIPEVLPGETLGTEEDLLDEAFWDQLEIEEDSEHETPPESPEIFAIPTDEETDETSDDAAPALDTLSEEEDADTTLEEELFSPLPVDFPPAGADEAAPVAEAPPSGDADGGDLATSGIQKSLERTVEAIVPALLRRIETMVVEQLPGMVEKIVTREIEKIKRGE